MGQGPVRVRALEFPLLKGLGGKQLPSPGNHRSLLPKGRGSSHTGSSRGLAQEPGRRARVSSPCLDSEERNVPLKSSSVGSGLNAEPSCPLRDLQEHSGPLPNRASTALPERVRQAGLLKAPDPPWEPCCAQAGCLPRRWRPLRHGQQPASARAPVTLSLQSRLSSRNVLQRNSFCN